MYQFKKLLILVLIAFPMAAAMAGGIYLYRNLPLKTAKYYLQTGDLDAASASINGFLESYPTDPYGNSIKAQILSHRQDHLKAVSIYNRVGAVDKEDYQCFIRSLFATGQWNLVPQVSKVYHKQFPKDPEVLRWTTICYMYLSQWDLAIESSNELITIKGFEFQGWALLGDCYAATGNLNRAFNCWEKSIDQNPSILGLHRSPEQFLQRFCDALLAAKRPKRAIKVLQEKSQVPFSPELHFTLGKCFLATGEVSKAKKQWRISNQSSIHVQSLVELSRQLWKEGKQHRALETISTIEHSSVVNIDLARLLASICGDLNETEKKEYWAQIESRLQRLHAIEQRMKALIYQQPISEQAIVFNCYFYCRSGNWEKAAVTWQSQQGSIRSESIRELLKQCIGERKLSSQVLEKIQNHYFGNQTN